MSDTTILRTSAIVRNATISPPQHGPVKTGALPLVQVRMAPGGPQIQEGQQKPVEILPPRDEKSAIATGGLPMVHVKMTQNGAQLDDGRDQSVIVRDAKHAGVATGGLPMIQVKMDGGKPQVQTIQNVQGGPPQIPAAAPALSAQRVPRAVGVHVARVPAPARQVIAAPVRQVIAAPVVLLPVPDLSTDQLMLCRHLVEKYLGDLREADAPAEDSAVGEYIKLAEATIVTIDVAMGATAVRAEAEAAAALAAAAAPAAPAVVPLTQSFAAAASIAPAPSASYVAGRVGGRPQGGYTGGARSHRNGGMAPRRVIRPGDPQLPPVIVKMEGRQPVVQSAPVTDPALVAEAVTAEVMGAPPAIESEIEAGITRRDANATTPATPATDAQG